MEQWLAIFRDTNAYSLSELQALQTKLKAQVENTFASQTAGTRGYTKESSKTLADKLAAVTQAIAERTGQAETRHFVADFSEVQP